VLTASGVLNVFNTDVNLLLDDAVAVELVDNNTDSAGSDVKDDTSLTMVKLVGKTLLDGTVTLNVDELDGKKDKRVNKNVEE
jgi:hypothetical protein